MAKRTRFLPRLLVENVDAIITPLSGGLYLPMLQSIVASAKLSVDVIQYQWNFYPHEKDNPLQQFNQGILSQIRNGIKYRVILNIESITHKITRFNQRAKDNLE